MRRLALVLAATTACAPSYRFSPIAGVMVDDAASPIDDKELAAVLLSYEAVLNSYDRHLFSMAVARTLFRFVDGCGEGSMTHTTSNLGRVIEVGNSCSCLARSELIHELTHLFQLASDGVADHEHKDLRYWNHRLVKRLRMHVAKSTCGGM